MQPPPSDSDLQPAWANERMRFVSHLSLGLTVSWLRVAELLERDDIVYDDLIFREKSRMVAELIMYRSLHPVDDNYKTRNQELVAIELGPDFDSSSDTVASYKIQKSATDRIRRIVKALYDAMLIDREEVGNEVLYYPGKYLIEHYEVNIIGGVLSGVQKNEDFDK